MELVDKRGYLTVSLALVKEGKILLRKPEGIREWFLLLKVKIKTFFKDKNGFLYLEANVLSNF